MVEYSDNYKYAYVDNYKFTRDEKTGYFLSSKNIGTSRKRLHIYIWESINGDIPKGYHVHHKDENKLNNEIDNLELLDKCVHSKLHGKEIRNNEERMAKTTKALLECAIPKACEWHKSKEGVEWHKKHYKRTKDKLHRKNTFKCKMCGKEFESIREGFCSNKCKSAYRRKIGVDDVSRICVVCGKEFKCNKYSKAKTCSNKCRGISRCRNTQK